LHFASERRESVARSEQSANLHGRYGYLEKAFDGDNSDCLA
jgi:hypothetical protein